MRRAPGSSSGRSWPPRACAPARSCARARRAPRRATRAAPAYRFEDWLREILPEGRAEPAVAASLRALYAATADALLQPDMEFELLLPEDGQSIDTRTAALAQWCQGFLYGLGAGAIPDA